MSTIRSLKSDFRFARNLVGAVLGATVAVAAKKSEPSALTALSRAAKTAWGPAMLGAAVGILASRPNKNQNAGYQTAVGGLVGGAIGFCAGVAWESRQVTGAMARHAVSNVNVVRDARWLEKNPVAYG
jgi:uncharacterized protein YcfJ